MESILITDGPNAVSVIVKTDDVKALNHVDLPATVEGLEGLDDIPITPEMETLLNTDIEELLRTLLQGEIKDLQQQVELECKAIVLAATRKYTLEKAIKAKAKELENLIKVPEVVTLDDDDDDIQPAPTPVICGHCLCDEPALEGSLFCADPAHYYDGLAQTIPDFADLDFHLTQQPTMDTSTKLPTLETSLSSSSSDPLLTSTPVLTPELPSSLILTPPRPTTPPPPTPSTPPPPPPSEVPPASSITPENQHIPQPLLPPTIKKRSFVFKCYDRCCDQPASGEDYFCNDHFPQNQLGHPDIYNHYYGITAPIKRQKMFIPLTKRRKAHPTPNIKKFRPIRPKP